VCRRLATQGASNRDIAVQMMISPASVKRLLVSAADKFGIDPDNNNRTLIAVEFMRREILSQLGLQKHF
jgi:DNA-binding CsgD family transcriptional regulator